MKQKREILVSLFALMFIFCLGLVSALESANITVVTPGASGTLSGASAVFNCSVVAGYEAENYTTGYIYLQSASLTANTTESLMATVANTTAYDFNGTLDSTTVQDGTDYTFKCSLFNGTDYVNATRTGITIDNTIPQAPTLSPVNYYEITSTTTQTFTGTVVDENTTSCTYTIYRQGSSSDSKSASGSGTYATTSCTFSKTFTNSEDNGVYYWTVTASDGTNTTSSSTNQYIVNLPGGGGGVIDGGDVIGGDSDSKLGLTIFIVVVACILIFILYLLFRKD